MNVLVACEFSGVVRDAFSALGHNAWSCDLEPSESDNSAHFECDVREIIDGFDWDLLIAHPPCTHLCCSGAKHFAKKLDLQVEALEFVDWLLDLPIPRIALENPVGVISTYIRKPDQIIQPWQFGHGETKTTCLWLKGLPLLIPTNIVPGREARIHKMSATKTRSKNRSRTYAGIAQAMAIQWGRAITPS